MEMLPVIYNAMIKNPKTIKRKAPLMYYSCNRVNQ